jgi:hypothetical protein
LDNDIKGKKNPLILPWLDQYWSGHTLRKKYKVLLVNLMSDWPWIVEISRREEAN